MHKPLFDVVVVVVDYNLDNDNKTFIYFSFQVRKTPQMQQNMNEDQSQFTSEPYLTDECNQQRRGSQRRPNASASAYSTGNHFNVL